VSFTSPTTSPHVFGLSARLRAFSSGYRVASMTIRQLRPPKSAKSAAPGTAMPALRPHTCGVTGSPAHPRAPLGHGFSRSSRPHGPARPPLQGGLRRHRRRRADDFAGRLHTRSSGKKRHAPRSPPTVSLSKPRALGLRASIAALTDEGPFRKRPSHRPQAWDHTAHSVAHGCRIHQGLPDWPDASPTSSPARGLSGWKDQPELEVLVARFR
jgi:hypothetical protein